MTKVELYKRLNDIWVDAHSEDNYCTDLLLDFMDRLWYSFSIDEYEEVTKLNLEYQRGGDA